jgi:hypothetical protein
MSINLFDPKQFGFVEGSQIFGYPPNAKKLINESSLRIKGSSNYVQFWERVLTDRERVQLGGDVDKCAENQPSSMNLLCELRECWSRERAIIEIAHSLGYLSSHDYQWIRQLDTDAIPVANRTPTWNRRTGVLEFEGKRCRKIVIGKATNIVPLLDQFQATGWSTCIKFKFNTMDPQEIHQACRKLNANMEHISFFVEGEDLFWKPAGS